MKRLLVTVASLLSLASAATAQAKQHAAKSGTVPPQHEARERKLWEAFKNNATLSALLDGGFG